MNPNDAIECHRNDDNLSPSDDDFYPGFEREYPPAIHTGLHRWEEEPFDIDRDNFDPNQSEAI